MSTSHEMDEIALVSTTASMSPPGSAVEVHVVKKDNNKAKKCVKKYRRTPCTYFYVLICGVFVLFVIIGCAIVQTWDFVSSRHGHNMVDEQFHRQLVDSINKANLTWKAKYNKFASRAEEGTTPHPVDAETGKQIMSKFKLDKAHLVQDTEEHIRELQRLNVTIPRSFDSRQAWPLCWSVHQIFNQAGCGSCWAVSASSVMSDRRCIHSNATDQRQISALDLTSCCPSCGGCQGTHWSLSAFTHWKTQGVVSGGSYGTFEGCRPYSFQPNCGTPCPPNLYTKDRTPSCERTCDSTFDGEYLDDLHHSSKAYWLRAVGGSSEFTPIVKETLNRVINDKPVEVLQRELIVHGPFLACFTAAVDFQHYKSGIYKTDPHRSDQLYGHCAKILGWGEEKGQKYWLFSNTWGREWGENGFFRIDFAELPEEAVAGY